MTERVSIIDYGSGNLRSAAKAFERVIREEDFDFEIIVTSDAAEIETAARLVLPGQGAFGDCISGLKSKPALYQALLKSVKETKKPFMGICVGMQLLADKGFEHGEHQGLGWIGGNVRKMRPKDATLKIPHMGWNTIEVKQSHPVLRHVKTGDHFYFVHSFMFESEDSSDILATADYGGEFPAIVARDNVIGTQFHVEKSQEAGLRLIKGFLEWEGFK